MKPATTPRSARSLRILAIDACSGAQSVHPSTDLANLLEPGDLVVVNDAATLPSSLFATTSSGAPIELRLVSALDATIASLRFVAALLGAGDYHTPTELRPLPPRVMPNDILQITGPRSLSARVLSLSPFASRLLTIELSLSSSESPVAGRRSPVSSSPSLSSLWAALYAAAKPVQYAHVPSPLSLWDVQNIFASRPWAVEMPSAGRAIRAETLLALRRRGIEIATITHAAGISATGDPAIDARLPLPERFEVSDATASAVLRTRARGGRVIAIGTSVVRALESAAHESRANETGPIRAASGITELLLHPGAERLVVDALLTGVHESDTTHFTLLGAFAGRAVLDAALATAERESLLGHEFGDAWLVWGARPTERATEGVPTRGEGPRPVASRCASWSAPRSATVAA